MGKCCKMKGLLTFLVLWLIYKGHSTGVDISKEIEKRRGTKPSPGTIYPVLKDLKEKGMISEENKHYTLTKEGRCELGCACKEFKTIFYDMEDICGCK